MLSNDYFYHKYKMLNLAILSPILLGLFLKGWDLNLYSNILKPSSPAGQHQVVDNAIQDEIEGATYYYANNNQAQEPQNPSPVAPQFKSSPEIVTRQVASDESSAPTPRFVPNNPAPILVQGSPIAQVQTSPPSEDAPHVEPPVKAVVQKPVEKKEVVQKQKIKTEPKISQEAKQQDPVPPEPSFTRFAGTGSAIAIPPSVEVTRSTQVVESAEASSFPAPSKKEVKEAAPSEDLRIKAEPYFKPSVVMANQSKVWVKTALQKTSIFNKGEYVPGFGVYGGLSSEGGSPVFESK